ncbi:TPR repeat-containing protein [Umezakia ovalisporum]|uniref:CHAT domain-containing protein n=1 Tax=Umezakia ovalisporum TaxID=75695 RepID=UPI0006F05EBE|nr:TPR repeat-containing protein [Umezakia ovalisporum]
MLTQLLQWLNKFSNHLVGNQQSRFFKAARESEVTKPPPELTNADLELLYTQLLAGVQQGRGKQWAIQYLERMEDRISVERWIGWLLIFSEKLFLSPSSHERLAGQMMRLGELGIGKVGELSYDIGIRLLTGELSVHDQEYQESETRRSEICHTPPDSPGKELIHQLGELLWESEDLEFQTRAARPQVESFGEILSENTPELIWEYSVTDDDSTGSKTPIDSPGEILTENAPEWEYSVAVTGFTPPDEGVLGNLTEDFHDSEGQKAQIIKSQPGATTVSSPDTEEQSLANLEPKVTDTLDELLAKLDQSNYPIQQLGANLSPGNQILPMTVAQREVQGQDWFYQGLQQAKTGDLLGAIASYNQAIEMNPDAFEYWFNHALTLFHLQCFSEAIASYDEAIALKPHHYKSWYNRGATLGELGRFEEAMDCFEQAIAVQPENPEAWSSKGLALFKLGQIPAAISSYDQALDLEPQNPENWYYRGMALSMIEQYAEAMASYDKAIAIQADFHEVWIDRGVVLFNLGHWSQAINSWDQALASQPNLYLAWYNRAIALEQLGQREEAIASYDKAIAVKPDFHLAWYNQGVALFCLERFAEAIIAYDNALQIKLDYWEAWIGRGMAAGHLASLTSLNSLTNINTENPALRQGGYEGKLGSLEEGLKYIRPDTHPEGWGRLHMAKGNTYYDMGKKYPTSRNYWHQAIAEYYQALLTLATADFAELHLEVLQSLIKALLGTGQTAQALELQQQAADLLTQLLTESTRSDDSKKQIALKFAGIGQLEVDLAVEYGDLVEAWEMAEQGKNCCLTWQLYHWQEEIYTHYYSSVQQLLNPYTAIIYWHISPVSLHTFIIKYQAPSPILVFTPIQNVRKIDLEKTPQVVDEFALPEAVRRLIEFEDWLEDWHQAYQEYLSHAQDQHSKSNHVWRVDMEQKLLELKNILQITTITQEIKDITQLILIPHCDLHRLPLHTLFNISSPLQQEIPGHLTISYLLSVQKGLSGKAESMWKWSHQILLSVESPNSTNYSPLKFTKLESDVISQMFNNPKHIDKYEANKYTVENALFNEHQNIFHFAGRVMNNYNDPQKSALPLINGEQITLAEICQKNLSNYKLVTLSSAETEGSKNQNITTEYVDLASGFTCGGVPYVVTTLWTVESSSSALVMIDFYRRLQLNKSPVIALAEATLWLKELTALELTKWYEDLLKNLDHNELRTIGYLATYLYKSSKMVPDKKLYNHPYYWAAYKMLGVIN